MDHIQIALVDESGTIGMADLVEVAGALNAQVHEDLRTIWQSLPHPTVVAAPSVPPHTWSVRISKDIGDPSALGYHTDDGLQPYALVELDSEWTITASHELLEMIGDPWGNRMHSGRLPAGFEIDHADFGLPRPSSRVHYLRELSDPCEATSVEVGGVGVSDFLTPDWYRSAPKDSETFSAYGGCKGPREVATGGYVSFYVAETGHWWQIFNQGGHLETDDLGRFDKTKYGSIREWTDYCSRFRRSQV